MCKKLFFSLMLILCMALGADAQTVIPAGTQVPLALKNGISTGKDWISKAEQTEMVKEGDVVNFYTTQDVYDDDDNLIIPENTPATGKVTKFKKRGFWGSGAELQVTINELTLPNGTIIPLTNGKAAAAGNKSSLRKTIFWSCIFMFPVSFPVVCILPKGHHARIKAGFSLNATVARTIKY